MARYTLDPATKPMALYAVDQALVDELTFLVAHMSKALDPMYEIPEQLRDRFEQCMTSIKVVEDQ